MTDQAACGIDRHNATVRQVDVGAHAHVPQFFRFWMYPDARSGERAIPGIYRIADKLPLGK